MASSLQAKKRARQSQKRRLHNASRRSSVRTLIKRTLTNIREKDCSTAQISFRETVRLLDQFSRKRLVHPNKANRLKSRLNRDIADLIKIVGP
ncbi:30S ribosomal protein S20 [Coxiella endosymbiont of Amblyomma sculptum]|uniref:30S ribosomal protein S20 n=1 Tax=Coxiella endosymbiont of Amblyomma sculptum TaxID=2487929 RepID=UPI00132E9230|nr:30S ribosomal protein S20 [Coxiella endosymbiont of Amblyomma sculptum]QHG92491.1 30S ribosomal protein S20 [Coxiella endosymbiont of Amblyomma sculptum]